MNVTRWGILGAAKIAKDHVIPAMLKSKSTKLLAIASKDKNKAYAHYLLAICYYETIEGEKKDLAPLILSKNEFNFVFRIISIISVRIIFDDKNEFFF